MKRYTALIYLCVFVTVLAIAQNFGSDVTLLPGTSGTPVELRLREARANGFNYVALKAPTTLASNYTIITPTAWADNSVVKSGTGGQLVFGTVGSSNIADGSVTQAKIADSTVTATQIANGAFTATQIADASVTLGKIDPLMRLIGYNFLINNTQDDIPAGYLQYLVFKNMTGSNATIVSGFCWGNVNGAKVDMYNACTSGQVWASHLTCDYNEHLSDGGTHSVYNANCYVNVTVQTAPAGLRYVDVNLKIKR